MKQKKRNYQIILASQSKRRSQILSSCGIRHQVTPTHCTEIHPTRKKVIPTVMKNAQLKTRALYDSRKKKKSAPALILGADTLVCFKNAVLGKPRSRAEAKKLLRAFSAQTIHVYSGISVLDTTTGKSTSCYEKSSLSVKPILPADLNRYFSLLGPYDKAGGFSIEGVGALLFDSVRGSYFNILGLPLHSLNQCFHRLGHDFLTYCHSV